MVSIFYQPDIVMNLEDGAYRHTNLFLNAFFMALLQKAGFDWGHLMSLKHNRINEYTVHKNPKPNITKWININITIYLVHSYLLSNNNCYQAICFLFCRIIGLKVCLTKWKLSNILRESPQPENQSFNLSLHLSLPPFSLPTWEPPLCIFPGNYFGQIWHSL